MAEYFVKRPTRREPVHPGELLKTDVLPALSLSISELSEKLHISRQQVHRILAGTQSISAGVALKISKLTGVSSHLLMSMQQSFDLWHAEHEMQDELSAIETLQLKEPESLYQRKGTNTSKTTSKGRLPPTNQRRRPGKTTAKRRKTN